MSAQDRRTLQTALDLYNAGQAAQAEPLLQALVRRYPTSFEANEALGGLYAEAGTPAKALPLLQQAAKSAPDDPIAQANLGATYLKLGRTVDAVQTLTRAADLDPENTVTASILGQALLLSGQPAAAAKAFTQAIKYSPADPDLLYNAALALFESGSISEADLTLNQIPPQARSDATHALAGDIDERLGRFQQAVAEFQTAAQLNPSEQNLYALTADLLRHWTWKQAAVVAQFGSSRYPESKHFQLAAGVAHYADNDYKAAVPIFAALLASDPDDLTAADLLGRSCNLLPEAEKSDGPHNPGGLSESHQEATDPGAPSSREVKGWGPESSNTAGVTGCSSIYSFALRHPGNAIIDTYAAVSLMRSAHTDSAKQQADLAEARRLLQQAIAADPKNAEALYQIGVLDQTQLRWKESADVLERSVSLRPRSSEAHYRLSRAYAHLGQTEGARSEIALQQKLSQEEKNNLNARLAEVVTFVLKPS